MAMTIELGLVSNRDVVRQFEEYAENCGSITDAFERLLARFISILKSILFCITFGFTNTQPCFNFN